MAQKNRPQAETLSGSPQPGFIGYSTAPILAKRAPTALDTGFPLGQEWVYKSANTFYILTSVVAGSATWVLGATNTGPLNTLTGDSGGAISPSAGNINTLGTANQITTTGSGSSITASIPSTFIAPGTITAASGAITATNGNLVLGTAGNKITSTSVATTTAAGANSFGTVTLVGGTATVATTAITTNSIVFLTRQTVGATGAAALGQLSRGTIVNGTSFVINAWSATDATSLQASDVSNIGWMIVN